MTQADAASIRQNKLQSQSRLQVVVPLAAALWPLFTPFFVQMEHIIALSDSEASDLPDESSDFTDDTFLFYADSRFSGFSNFSQESREDYFEAQLCREEWDATDTLQEFWIGNSLGILDIETGHYHTHPERECKEVFHLADWTSQCLVAAERYRATSAESHWRPVNAMSAIRNHAKLENNVVDMAPLTVTSESSRPTTLRQAWQSNNFEAVISLASGMVELRASAAAFDNVALIRELVAALRHRFLAYDKLGLANLAVADAKRILELTAKFGSDAVVQVDEDLLPKLASLDTVAVPVLETGGDRAPKRPAHDTLGGTLIKRAKAGDRLHVRKVSIIQLPVEVILLIADHLDAPDRIKLANTRVDWRRFPELWRTLKFVRIKHNTTNGWQRDTIDACVTAIETCQRKSHNTLSSVVLKGPLNSEGVAHILEALQSSSHSLRHLAIPTLDQKQCFTHLYKRCLNLTDIDVRLGPDGGSRHSGAYGSTTSLFESSKLPFKLKRFISDQSLDAGDIAHHMQGLEIVHGLKFVRQKQINFIDGIVRAAPTLLEWVDDTRDYWDNTTVALGDYSVSRTQLPTSPIIFPKLRKLSAFWAEHFIECAFPALVEARLNSQRGISSLSPTASDESCRVAAIVLKSPSLKKLDILLPSSYTEIKQIFSAIATLPKLEELGLWMTSPMPLNAFVKAQKSGGDKESFLILPHLQTMRLCYRTVSANDNLHHDLSELLLLRFYLKHGCNFKEAKDRTEAAFLAYNINTINYPPSRGMTKAQKKKSINASAGEAAGSCFKGDFTLVDGVKRENFSSVLPKLIVSRGLSQYFEKPTSMLNQLITRIVEVDTNKYFANLGVDPHHVDARRGNGRPYY
ncbi:nucleolar RNA methyltransferase [Pseudozyma hubeiensis SY62]|uniref:Nucleolar RNA methyltransferase n=1 Tax=Pseudozyma hubeiensis (strain SY62) TaxID=1305764 RepID=R9NYM9_PSEHS|nr:nucleolar RNA methyltransferase [Pseudozyma hubeiensis SY62]GAC93898.1 nucleolar RNA methyltransferase [Pseudozyma hubeiensis SY62]